MSLFEKKPQISRKELRETLKKTPGEKLTPRQRLEIEKGFETKYGEFISRTDYGRELRELTQEKFKTRDPQKKLELNRKIRYLRKLGGI